MLANLFLHYVFDKWIVKDHPEARFERYADDIVVHCQSKEEAVNLLQAIEQRFISCKLRLNKAKTSIVYCSDSNRHYEHAIKQFDFLGYTFRPRKAMNRKGEYFISFTPAASKHATKAMRQRFKLWKLHRQVSKSIEEIAEMINPALRGWINYYGKYYPSELTSTFATLNRRLTKWASRKFKGMRGRKKKAGEWLSNLARKNPKMFAHWQLLGIKSFHW